MIAFLEGVVILKGEKFAVVRAAGLGYKVFCGADTMAKMPENGVSVKLWIHDHVREDARELYGFLYFAELELFEMLIAISGIGKKIAEKVILELREKMAGRGVSVAAPELKDEADALDAMVSLGYSPREARDALAAVPKEITSVEKRVREALKKMQNRT